MLAYELLFGRGDITGGGKAKAALMACKARLQAELARLKIRRKAVNNEDLVAAQIEVAQYVRCHQQQQQVVLQRCGVGSAR